MAGIEDAAGVATQPAPAPAAAVAAPAAETTAVNGVQDAIDAAVAQFRAQLESKIKTSLGVIPAIAAATPGLVSRLASDTKTEIADVASGTREASGDFLDVIRGKPMQVQDSTGAEHSVPRWLVWTGVVFAFVGVATVADLALHALNVLH